MKIYARKVTGIKIYVAIWEDRHTDVIVEAFSTEELAIAWAHAAATNISNSYSEERFSDNTRQRSGWIYSITYSSDGDHITVVETCLDAAALTRPKNA